MKKVIPIVILIFWFIGPLFALFAQTFTKITDNSNPIVTTSIDGNYSGAAWIDYDNDGDLDLYTTKSFLFRNDGNGNFTQINTIIGNGFVGGTGNGTSWGDYDNDGLIDIFLAGNPSALYRNTGNDSFQLIAEGDLLLDKRGWTPSWGDYDNDGYLDLVITHPANFVGPPTPSHFYSNNGDGRLSKLFNFEFTSLNKAYTVASWSDYDLDGDIDLFIGSGPAVGTIAPDNLYKNTLIETGTPDLVRIETSPIATDQQDGQVWNWIDYDNDRDLDAFLTNYGGAPNRFYRNDNGNYISVTNELVFGGSCLANTWGDFDNDGLLDVIITSEESNYFFKNNGDGSFTNLNNPISQNGPARGATIGDYNNDGMLDVFLSGNNQGKGLFINNTQNNNNWINISLTGIVSNRSAIGTKVKAKAIINGTTVWQFREISAQNSFDGHNSLRVHFGFGNASMVDSLIIEWPAGSTKVYTNLTANKFYNYTEEIPIGYLRVNFRADKVIGFDNDPTINFTDLSLTDLNNPVNTWQWDFNNDGIVDATNQNPSWTYPGLGEFTVKLAVNNGSASETRIRNNYIKIQRAPGQPLINYFLPTIPDTTIPRNGSVRFVVTAVDTTDYPLSFKWFRNIQQTSTDSFYNYQSNPFLPERTDTIRLEISNSYNTTIKTWLIHVANSTDISDKSDHRINYNLEQNYPNPFNPSTKIKFSIPSNELVNLSIYDILGNKIATLIDEYKSVGSYEIEFNTRQYSNVTSGLYFYSLKAGKYSTTKKMILLK